MIDFRSSLVYIVAIIFRTMIDRIILDIHHSDDYTDYLFMTAGLTNKRIIPMVGASQLQIKAATDINTLVLHCINSRARINPWERPVSVNTQVGSVRVLSRFYLDDDGSINAVNAEVVRQTIQEAVMNTLMTPQNLLEVYRHYFPILWSKRQMIYADPKLFFADSGRYYSGISNDYLPIGAILKAIDEDPKNFRIRLGGGCSCGQRPFLIDWDRVYGEHWTLYTWCPVCHARREIRAWNFQRAWNCERSIGDSLNYYDKGQGSSSLSLFDVIDASESA